MIFNDESVMTFMTPEDNILANQAVEYEIMR